MARLCAHGRSVGCARSDQRHGKLRATNISLWRTGNGTAVIVPEWPFVPRGRLRFGTKVWTRRATPAVPIGGIRQDLSAIDFARSIKIRSNFAFIDRATYSFEQLGGCAVAAPG